MYLKNGQAIGVVNPIKADQNRQNEGIQVPKNKYDADRHFYAIRNRIMRNCDAN